MERGNLLQFPFRDNQTEQLKKAIDIISKMDDKAFERFSEMCIKKMRQEENFKKDANPNEITEILKLLRKNPEIITQSFSNLNNQNIKSSDGATISNSVIVCLLIGGISSLLVWIYFFLAMVLIFFLAIIGFPTFQAIPDCLPD
jgi:Flp pilus assembly protein TadB